MSQLTGTLTKKRKLNAKNDAERVTKKSRKDSKTKKKDQDKLETSAEGEFKVVNGSLIVSIPPIFANSPRTGVEEMLDSMVMRCVVFLPLALR
jgi:DNA-directed RNA polymerase I subunit RPA43